MLDSFFKIKPNKSIVTVIDIGSSKIACVIAEIDKNANIKVLASSHQFSKGFRAGIITNMNDIEESIIFTLEQAEKQAGINVDKVVLTFSGAEIFSSHAKGSIRLAGGNVNDSDLSNVVRNAVVSIDREKYEIIHYFPLEYKIDNSSGIKNPKGLYAQNLKCELSLILIPIANLYNIVNCLAKCHVDVEDVVISPYSSSLSCITNDEAAIGTTIIDFGAATTSYVIFDQESLIHSGYIPVGGSNITSDISKVFSTNFLSAERIKILHSSAKPSFADNHKMIDIPVIGTKDSDSRELESVSCGTLNKVVNARVEEIFEMLKAKIERQNVDRNLTKRIILIGGTSQLLGIRELASNIFDSKVKIGRPRIPSGMNKDNRAIYFSSAIGALQYFAGRHVEDLTTHSKNEKKKFSIIDWIKENI